MTPSHIRAVLLTLPPLLLTTPALAGPTLSTDLDLGTSTQSFPPGALPPSPLYTSSASSSAPDGASTLPRSGSSRRSAWATRTSDLPLSWAVPRRTLP